jgi:hypothetical protein
MKTASFIAASRQMIRVVFVSTALLIVWLLVSALAVQAKAGCPAPETECDAPAQDPDSAILQNYVGHQYILNADRLYTAADNAQGYELVPLWQQEEVTVQGVETVPGSGLRFYVVTASGVAGYFEVEHLTQVHLFLGPAPIQVSAML